MIARLLAAALAASLPATGALAQALDQQPTKALAELLNDGFAVLSTTGNGRPGELLLTLRREAKHYVCVLSEVRGNTYSEAKAKPLANPCIPLN
ncbi:hypothetical protein [Prosthecomicrobium sp. N25]|uniref:hypothetical protein n=1 Tax=Prosthecomicrobium sp. N25 TaxID=3129254 RepID=UPI0030780693